MIAWIALASVGDAALAGYVIARLLRARRDGVSLRLRIFIALSTAAMLGALVTGLAAIVPDLRANGVYPVATRVAPKGFLVGSAIVAGAALVASAVGRLLARSIERLAVMATRLAAGDDVAHLPFATDREARQLARALSSMRREIVGQPYAAAFLRDAWHDLKTPVAAIKATIEVLEDGALDDRPTAERLLDNMRRSSDRLERTLADLITLARFQTAVLAPDTPITVTTILAAAIETARPLADARAVRIEIAASSELELRCDEAAIGRAIATLVVNAVEGSPAGLVALAAVARDDRIVIEVRNEPGEVPLEVRGRLFERAVTSRGHAGSGLGLAIARAAIEAHSGTVEFVELGPPRVVVRLSVPRG